MWAVVWLPLLNEESPKLKTNVIWHWGWAGILRRVVVCVQDDYEYVYTKCDARQQRWRVAVPKASSQCDVADDVPPPVKGRPCGKLSRKCESHRHLHTVVFFYFFIFLFPFFLIFYYFLYCFFLIFYFNMSFVVATHTQVCKQQTKKIDKGTGSSQWMRRAWHGRAAIRDFLKFLHQPTCEKVIRKTWKGQGLKLVASIQHLRLV